MQRIRILVAEDETLLRVLLARRLASEADFEVVGEAADGRQAVELARVLQPDVVVMDLHMPLLNGAQATEKIVSQQKHTKVIILTVPQDLTYVGKSFGAFEALDKGCTPQELVEAIRRARSEPAPSAPKQGPDYRAIVERIASEHRLTYREKVVLERVVSTELTVQQIARALSTDWQEKVTESSVRHTIERVMSKLGIEPRTRSALVKYVLEAERKLGA